MKKLFYLLLFVVMGYSISCEWKGKEKEVDKKVLPSIITHEVESNMDTAIAYANEVEYLTVRDDKYDEFLFHCNRFINLNSIRLCDFNNKDFHRIFDSLSKLESLEKLIISNYDDSKIANNIYKLKHLKILDIENQDIKVDLPDSISYCANMEKLYFSNYKALPKNMNQLKKLKYIELGKAIPVFPKELLLVPSLERILIVGKLTDVPKDIVKLKNLKYLNLFQNPIAKAETTYFLKHKKYNKLQFIIEQMPQCNLMLYRTGK